MRKMLDYLLYPILLGAGLSIAWLLNKHGWKSYVAASIAFWGYVAALRLLEEIRPFEPSWNRSDGQFVNDIAIAFSGLLIYPLSAGFLAGLAWAISRFQPLHSLHIWPTHWPAFLAIPLGIIIYDLGNHLTHRWSHTVPIFWRFHAVHHSAPRLSVINAARMHPINALLGTVLGMPIPILLGIPPEIAMWYFGLLAYGGILTHANIDMQCGVFSYLINTPELHRWHHSRHQPETDTNYGEGTMLWDHLFRTFYHPKRRPPRDVGVDFPVSAKLIDQLIQPFTLSGHKPGTSEIHALPAGEAGVR